MPSLGSVLQMHVLAHLLCLWCGSVNLLRSAARWDTRWEKPFRYFLMLASQFDNLVGCLQPFISHQCMHGMSITIHQRLEIILWLLAAGDTNSSSILANIKKSFLHNIRGLQLLIRSMLILQEPRNVEGTRWPITAGRRLVGRCTSGYIRGICSDTYPTL